VINWESQCKAPPQSPEDGHYSIFAEQAGKLIGELEANSAESKKDKAAAAITKAFMAKTNASLLAKLKDDHAAELKNKDDAHTAAKNKVSKDHENVKKALHKEMNDKSDKHIAAMQNLSKEHDDKTNRLVSVNANFLKEVQRFVEVVKSLLSKRAQYEGVFAEIDSAIVHISTELVEFTGHTVVAPKAHSLHPPAKAS